MASSLVCIMFSRLPDYWLPSPISSAITCAISRRGLSSIAGKPPVHTLFDRSQPADLSPKDETTWGRGTVLL